MRPEHNEPHRVFKSIVASGDYEPAARSRPAPSLKNTVARGSGYAGVQQQSRRRGGLTSSTSASAATSDQCLVSLPRARARSVTLGEAARLHASLSCSRLPLCWCGVRRCCAHCDLCGRAIPRVVVPCGREAGFSFMRLRTLRRSGSRRIPATRPSTIQLPLVRGQLRGPLCTFLPAWKKRITLSPRNECLAHLGCIGSVCWGRRQNC